MRYSNNTLNNKFPNIYILTKYKHFVGRKECVRKRKKEFSKCEELDFPKAFLHREKTSISRNEIFADVASRRLGKADVILTNSRASP